MRQRLPNRRANITEKIDAEMDGRIVHLIITIGFEAHEPREVFCASLRAGTTLNAIIADACVQMSLLLQMGMRANELANKLCDPPSPIGSIAKAVARHT